MSTLPRHRDLALAVLSLASRMFGIPAIVLTEEMLIVRGILSIVAVIAGLLVMRSKTPAVKALSIDGFVPGRRGQRAPCVRYGMKRKNAEYVGRTSRSSLIRPIGSSNCVVSMITG